MDKRFRLVYALKDALNGVYAYTVEDSTTGKWADCSLSVVLANIASIQDAYIDGVTHLPMSPNCKEIYVGTDHSSDKPTGGQLQTGFNDLYTWARKNGRVDIIAGYMAAKNSLPLNKVSQSSYNTQIHLVCTTCGYEFETTPNSLTRKKGFCPACDSRKNKKAEIKTIKGTPRRVVQGINDLRTWCQNNSRQDIIAAWSPENTKSMGEISIKSDRMFVLLTCRSCGKTIQTKPYLLTQAKDPTLCTDCKRHNTKEQTKPTVPIDASNKTIDITHPQVLSEWDYETNSKNGVTPEMFTWGSHKEVSWICKKCKTPHSYTMAIRKKCLGQGCPLEAGKRVQYGINDIMSQVPNFILRCWDKERNEKENLDPAKLTPNSRKEAYFKCPYCGYSWVGDIFVTIGQRLKRRKVPSCPNCKKELPFP